MTMLTRSHPIARLCAAAVALLALAGCGSSGGSTTGTTGTTAAPGRVSATRLARSFARVLDASFGKGPRDMAVGGPAKCRPAGQGTWRCTVTIDTASPEGAVDMEQTTYRVRLTSGTCWTATETGVTGGMPGHLHGCA